MQCRCEIGSSFFECIWMKKDIIEQLSGVPRGLQPNLQLQPDEKHSLESENLPQIWYTQWIIASKHPETVDCILELRQLPRGNDLTGP